MAIIIDNMNLPNTCSMCWISNICQEHIHDLKHIGWEHRLDECPLHDFVQCKDCKFWQTDWETSYDGYHYCSMIDDVIAGDFYCKDAERKILPKL